MKTRLIIGCGYLGRRIAERWLANGDSVMALTRSEERAEQFRHQQIEPIIGDVTIADSLSHLPAADTCLYAVGLDRSSGASHHDVYVDGLRNALAQLAGKVGQLIYISSTSVYGQSQGEEVDEQSETQPLNERGQNCLTAEQLVRDFQSSGTSINILRLSGIYGPDRLLRRATQVRNREPIAGNADAWLNLIHVDDAAQAVLACEQHGRTGETYLVSDDEPVRRRDYYGTLAELVGGEPPLFSEGETPRHAVGQGKQCRNQRVREKLSLELQYPTYREGLPAAWKVSSMT
ncbi:SDR family oxidoreductase [Calycomorphotria hydatis]|uniref:Short chain dehydrogenase n=1 Tax=Calycomorphotria hydatis TaxID=2528027 RepID=A0A517TF19_9PLAN|nr:SDR family oxidoreductase [Calycomorphotria hydatis]QDT66958.1 short chain dehydrogenase [Calycomorphotria hydatis]